MVGIEDAAHAMVLAAERGRTGERYIISDKYLSTRDVHATAARAGGVAPPRIKLPLKLLYLVARLNDVAARMFGRDLPFAVVGLRMAELMSPLDHSKAECELGWKPAPVEKSIAEAAKFFTNDSH